MSPPKVHSPTLGHWLATYVGLLTDAFSLTDDEQYQVSHILKQLFLALRIPERPAPAVVPLPVVQEMLNGHYSDALGKTVTPPVRATRPGDCVASLEAWRTPLERMLESSYELSIEEMILLRKVLADTLAAIGVPHRAAAWFPDAVMAAHREIEETVGTPSHQWAPPNH